MLSGWQDGAQSGETSLSTQFYWHPSDEALFQGQGSQAALTFSEEYALLLSESYAAVKSMHLSIPCIITWGDMQSMSEHKPMMIQQGFQTQPSQISACQYLRVKQLKHEADSDGEMCSRLWHATERRVSSKRTGWERRAHKKCMSNRRRCHIRYVSSCRDAGVWRPLRVKGTSELRSKRREVRRKST